MLTPQYTSFVRNQLANFAAQDNFDLAIATAFGNNFDLSQLADLRQQWLAGDFSVIPTIQVLTEGELRGANGAYAAELDRIFISSDFLATASEASITSVLLEEVGHRIDQLLNGNIDSAGDEGEIFSALARGIDLSPETLAALQSQNDHAVITVGGRSITVEENTFNGTEGDDTYGGSPADDLIYGYGGKDTLFGADGNDTIYGGFSNSVGNDDDSINGGYGSDSIFGANGNDSIDAGNDFLYNFVSGGDGNDTILGSFGSDFLEGDSQFNSNEFGNDFINGYSGADTVLGGLGDDTIFGGSDNDLIYGGSGINSLYGEDGLDTIYSGSAYENGVGTGIVSGSIDGGMGDDDIYGDNKNDSINGGDGNDYILGGGGNDTIIGSAGNDTISGNNGNDSIEGGIGNDLLVGDGGNDTILGNDGDDSIDGGDGNDELRGGNGNDYISGGSGNDYIDVNFLASGNDTADGGVGDDLYFIGGALTGTNYTIIENTNGGTDTLRFVSGVNINLSVNTAQTLYEYPLGHLGSAPYVVTLSGSLDDIENIEVVNGTGAFAGNASSVLTGNALNNFIDGGNGNDGIAGGSGSDTINGNDGDDLLSGGLDADLIKGGNGNDLIFGDGFFPGNSNDTLDGGAGNNTLNGGGGDDLFIIYDYVNGFAVNALGENTNGGIDTISIIAAGVNPISLDLSATATQTVATGNQLTASSLADIENITLSAPLSVNGYLSGNSLNNIITGGSGNDTLVGAGGRDTLIGGYGSDRYVVSMLNNFAGTVINDIDGNNDSLSILLTFNPKILAVTDFQKAGTSLLYDLNGDQQFDTVNDLTVLNFFAADNSAGVGFIENINNLSGTTILNKFQTVRTDLGNDQKSDIVWRNSSGEVYTYQMNGLSVASEASLGIVVTIGRLLELVTLMVIVKPTFCGVILLLAKLIPGK